MMSKLDFVWTRYTTSNHLVHVTSVILFFLTNLDDLFTQIFTNLVISTVYNPFQLEKLARHELGGCKIIAKRVRARIDPVITHQQLDQSDRL